MASMASTPSQQAAQPEYTLPGVLHYLQVEWRRYERDRNEWEIERAEMKARIALLEGERRGIENVKMDLLKRVKMLEIALRQERQKYLSMTLGSSTGTELKSKEPEKEKPPTIISTQSNINGNVSKGSNLNANLLAGRPPSLARDPSVRKQSREFLQQCLREVTYLTQTSAANTISTTRIIKEDELSTSQHQPSRRTSIVYLGKKERLDEISEEGVTTAIFKPKRDLWQDDEAQLVKDVQQKFHLSEDKVTKILKKRATPPVDTDLANLTVDEVDGGKVWKTRYTLSSHLDAVRSISFHKSEPSILSGSEDGTVRFWRLEKNSLTGGDIEPQIVYRGHTAAVTSVILASEQNKGYSASMDSTVRVWSLPPIDRDPYAPVDYEISTRTLVGHTDVVWDLRLYPIFNGDSQILASSSADGTIKIWDTGTCSLKLSLGGDEHNLNPTSIDFIPSDLGKIAVSYTNSLIRLYDLETGQVVSEIKSIEIENSTPETQINRLTSHPTLPLLFSGHEDKYIRFFDVNSNRCVHSMNAHLDAVTSLDVDNSGLCLVSGGHDCSVRFWDLRNIIGSEILNTSTSNSDINISDSNLTINCIQEFTSHRKKSDEGVLDVKYHPSLLYVGSCGADGVVKIYS